MEIDNTTTATAGTELVVSDSAPVPPWLTRTLTTLAYGIPLAFLAYVLYINYLPFGYEKTFTLDVGAKGDTDRRNVLFLEPSPDLSPPQSALNLSLYRELNGVASLIFNPPVVLKDAEITVEIEGTGVGLIPPVIDFDPNSTEWDFAWDFTQNQTAAELGLVGDAFLFDGAMYFNDSSHLELPDSADRFEDGPFTVYVEWTPYDSEHDGQQIVGHFNWEIWQNTDSVEFRVGRMGDAEGPAYTITYDIGPDFFNTPHEALAVYRPQDSGYIDLYIDGLHTGRKYFGAEKIWTEYGNKNLSLGWTSHNYGKSPHFTGAITGLNIKTGSAVGIDSLPSTSTLHHSGTTPLLFTIVSTPLSRLDGAYIHITQ